MLCSVLFGYLEYESLFLITVQCDMIGVEKLLNNGVMLSWVMGYSFFTKILLSIVYVCMLHFLDIASSFSF